MRIIYYHHTQAEDAQWIHILEMVHAFHQLGHEVDIVSLFEPRAGPQLQFGKLNLRKNYLWRANAENTVALVQDVTKAPFSTA